LAIGDLPFNLRQRRTRQTAQRAGAPSANPAQKQRDSKNEKNGGQAGAENRQSFYPPHAVPDRKNTTRIHPRRSATMMNMRSFLSDGIYDVPTTMRGKDRDNYWDKQSRGKQKRNGT